MNQVAYERISRALKANLQFQIYLKGFTQTKFADLIKIPRTTLSAICTGNHVPCPTTLKKIADGLELSITALLNEPNSSTKTSS